MIEIGFKLVEKKIVPTVKFTEKLKLSTMEWAGIVFLLNSGVYAQSLLLELMPHFSEKDYQSILTNLKDMLKDSIEQKEDDRPIVSNYDHPNSIR